ncbi:hypothetical protein SDC9_161132 [bioreactor metagenome]|uniref:Uncharacterized protein n=1 Tax=bioreactor metagenome TaxID=1076179 RepID=A0A645FJI0_9ZZZZ
MNHKIIETLQVNLVFNWSIYSIIYNLIIKYAFIHAHKSIKGLSHYKNKYYWKYEHDNYVNFTPKKLSNFFFYKS